MIKLKDIVDFFSLSLPSLFCIFLTSSTIIVFEKIEFLLATKHDDLIVAVATLLAIASCFGIIVTLVNLAIESRSKARRIRDAEKRVLAERLATFRGLPKSLREFFSYIVTLEQNTFPTILDAKFGGHMFQRGYLELAEFAPGFSMVEANLWRTLVEFREKNLLPEIDIDDFERRYDFSLRNQDDNPNTDNRMIYREF